MVAVTEKPFAALTKEERARAHELTLSPTSSMRRALETGRDREYRLDDAVALLARDRGRIVGWALLMPYPACRKKPRFGLYVYVDLKRRRRGIGRLLVFRAADMAQRTGAGLRIHAWDETSSAFYGKVLAGTDTKVVRRGTAGRGKGLSAVATAFLNAAESVANAMRRRRLGLA